MNRTIAATFLTFALMTSSATGSEPWLGMFLDPQLPPGRGQPIAEITPGGPAEAAGIRPGDLLLSVDGFPIRRAADIGRAVQGRRPGERVRVDVERRGRTLRFEVRLGDRTGETAADRFQPQNEPAELPPANRFLGVAAILPTERDLEQLKIPARFTRGALVLEVLPGSPAADAGLRRTDLIVAFDGQAVDSPTELLRRSTQAGPGTDIQLEFARGEAIRTIKLRLTDPDRFVVAPVTSDEAEPVWSIEDRLDAIERHLRRLDDRMTRMEISLEQLEDDRGRRPLPPRR